MLVILDLASALQDTHAPLLTMTNADLTALVIAITLALLSR
jgi:hypothetical protein